MFKAMNIVRMFGIFLIVYFAAHVFAVGESMMHSSRAAKDADYLYISFMPSREIDGMRTMLHSFSVAHGMSFQWGPLNPEGSEIAVELIGHGTRVFALNMADVKEFVLDIRSYGHEADYEAVAGRLSDDLVAELKKLPDVVTKWERLPVGYATDLSPARRAARGQPPQ